MEDKLSFSMLYGNRQDIMEHPEQYKVKVTNFLAGAHGTCVYSEHISAAELVKCWNHEEYQTPCPKCKETAYITRWAGNCSSGGYWRILAICPNCGKEFSPRDAPHWTEMSKIVQEVRNELENYRYVNHISVFEAFSRDGWVRNHDFQAGNNWKKGEDEVTCLLGKYRLNGKEVDEEFIHQMLHIDKRYIQMCEFIGPDHLPKNKYHKTFFEGVKWADSTPPSRFDQMSTQSLNFEIIFEAFEKEGWENHHSIAGYNRWTKDGMEVKSVQGTYTLDEEPLNTSQLCEMLHIDNRTLQVSEAIAPNPIHDRYGQDFLAGVQWADEHPIEQYQNA